MRGRGVDADQRMTRSIEEHYFAQVVGFTDGAWLELAARGELTATLLDGDVQTRWRCAQRKAPRRVPQTATVEPPRFRPTADDCVVSAMVDLAFRAPRWRVFA